MTARALSDIRPVPRRGLSRVEAAIYLGCSPSKFDDLRRDGRVGPARLIDGRKVWDVRKLRLGFRGSSGESADRPKTGPLPYERDSLLTMPRRLPPGCVEDRDRHGTIRIYYRSKSRPKVRLRGTPWTPEFMAEYDAAKGGDADRRVKPVTRRYPRHLALALYPLLRRMRGLQAP